MPWTAPAVARSDPPPLGDERSQLEAWLEFHRSTLLGKCAGLSADQLRRRSVVPSTLSLLGLVRHMAEVERAWFRRRMANQEVPLLHCSDEDPDGDFDNTSTADAEADFATFHTELELARAAARGFALDDAFLHPRHQQRMSLRWVYLHMIEEYARHNGHADLLRERIDGVSGD